MAAWQARCNYEPGDVVAVFTESQPAFTKFSTGLSTGAGTVEKGWYHNDDAYNSQPGFLTDRFRIRSHGD